MVRSIVVSALLVSTAFLMTSTYTGYSRAGKKYFEKVREERKSIRPGSGMYVPFRTGSGSFRTGK